MEWLNFQRASPVKTRRLRGGRRTRTGARFRYLASFARPFSSKVITASATSVSRQTVGPDQGSSEWAPIWPSGGVVAQAVCGTGRPCSPGSPEGP